MEREKVENQWKYRKYRIDHLGYQETGWKEQSSSGNIGRIGNLEYQKHVTKSPPKEGVQKLSYGDGSLYSLLSGWKEQSRAEFLVIESWKVPKREAVGWRKTSPVWSMASSLVRTKNAIITDNWQNEEEDKINCVFAMIQM